MNMQHITTPSSKNLLRAITLLVALGFGQAALAGDSTNQAVGAQARLLTRAEVIADLTMWRRAGLDQFEEADRYQLTLPGHEEALARYHALRHSAAYAEEVTRIAAARGDAAPSHIQ